MQTNRRGATKQVKTKSPCLHLHVLLCHFNMAPSTSTGTESFSSADQLHDGDRISITRQSTMSLNMSRNIPYPFLIAPMEYCQSMFQNWPTEFCPLETVCTLCPSQDYILVKMKMIALSLHLHVILRMWRSK